MYESMYGFIIDILRILAFESTGSALFAFKSHLFTLTIDPSYQTGEVLVLIPLPSQSISLKGGIVNVPCILAL